jgi:hypothetical protein
MTMSSAAGPVTIELGAGQHKARELEGAYAPPAHLKEQVLHEIPGLAAFVGVKDEKGRVLTAAPIFLSGDTPLTPVRAGIVLLCDLARDFTVENRLGAHNFSLGNADTLDRHVVDAYGKMTLEFLQLRFLGKPLGTQYASFLAKRMIWVLRINYPELKTGACQRNRRIVLEKPFTVLAKFDHRARFDTLLALADSLGTTWMDAEHRLLSKRPELADRARYFGDDGHRAA